MICAFKAGIRNVIDPGWLRIFSATEIGALIGGLDADIDVNDLKNHTKVHNIKCKNFAKKPGSDLKKVN